MDQLENTEGIAMESYKSGTLGEWLEASIFISDGKDTIREEKGVLSVLSFSVALFIVFQTDTSNTMHLLGAVYVLSCAYRSHFWVRVQDRLGLPHQSAPLSSPYVDRAVATCGEVCLAAIISHTINEHSRDCAVAVFFLIAMAQAWCWLATITCDNAFHIVEELHWAVASVIVSIVWPCGRILALAYCVYMLTEDVPMYIRLSSQQDPHRQTLIRSSDPWDCAKRSDTIQDWRGDMAWRALYFCIASCAIGSLALSH